MPHKLNCDKNYGNYCGSIHFLLHNLPFVVVAIKHQMDYWNNQLILKTPSQKKKKKVVLKTDPYCFGNVNVTFVVNTF